MPNYLTPKQERKLDSWRRWARQKAFLASIRAEIQPKIDAREKALSMDNGREAMDKLFKAKYYRVFQFHCEAE